MSQFLLPATMLYLCLIALPGNGAEQPDLTEYKEGVLTVEIPYDTVFVDEILHVNLSVENNGEKPIAIVKDGLNDMVQLVWIPWKDGAPEQRPGRIPGIGMFSKSPLELVADHNLVIYEWENLGPGKKHHRERVHAASLAGVLPPGLGTFQLRPALYGGNGLILYGEPVTMTVLEKRAKDFPVVFETTYGIGGGRLPMRIHEVRLQGETYLFDGTGARFCRIPPDVEYKISFEQKSQVERIMKVEFDRPDLEPLVFSWAKYTLLSASRETVPWLFAKPEEKVPAGASAGGGAAPVPASTPVPAVRVDTVAAGGKGWWLWVVVGVGVLIALGWVARKRAA